MELEERPIPFRRTHFLVLVAGLGVLTIGLGLLVGMAAGLAGQVGGPERKAVGRVAWLALVLLCVDVLLLFWVVARYFRDRLGHGPQHGPTEYVNIWAAAGQRVKLETPEGEEQDEGGQDEDESP